ncbi:MAG TPA: hypothetical protein VHY08_17735 [Bacillota bacterium]|nr:hypothetical protein [Bacillota bacterium]
MKRNWRLIILTVLGLTVLVLGIFIVANQAQISKNQSMEKNDLVAVIEEYQQNAKLHGAAFSKLLKIAEKANYNEEAIKTAAYIVANAGFHTEPVLEIAEIAGNADHEVGHLDELLELLIIYARDIDTIVGLARQAVNNEIDEADLVAKIALYRSQSQVKTVDEAVKNMEKELGGIDRKIEEVIQTIQRQSINQPRTQNNSEKEQLIATLKGYISIGQDKQSLTELLKIAATADYNYSVIKTAAYFLSKEGCFNNWTVVTIAKLAGGAGREIKQLNGLLEVSITYGGDSFNIIELAIKAVKNEASEAELESRIAYYRNSAAAKTIDETLENSKKMFSGF